MCATLGSQSQTTFVLTIVWIDALRRLMVAQTIPIGNSPHLVLESGTDRIDPLLDDRVVEGYPCNANGCGAARTSCQFR
jgi:hypothetical protein